MSIARSLIEPTRLKSAQTSVVPDTALPWRPFYLRRRVLIAFILLLLAFIAALETLLAISNRNRGLAPGDQNKQSVWRYGAIAIFTATAALWARVDCQAKTTAPWARLSRGVATADQTMLLDYLSLLPHKTIARAIKNRDFVVASTATVSILLNVLIVLSTSLITPSWLTTTLSSVPVTLGREFVDEPSGLQTTGSIAAFTISGLFEYNLSYPNGISSQFAYQPAASNLSGSAVLQTTVDGFSGNLTCEIATIHFVGSQPPSNQSAGWNGALNAILSTPECVLNLTFTSPYIPVTPYFGRFVPGSCNDSSDLDAIRVAILFGQVNTTYFGLDSKDHADEDSPLEILNSTQLICQPSYIINTVSVVRNGTQLLNISISDAVPPRTLSNVHSAELLEAIYQSYQNTAAPQSLFAIGADDSSDTLLTVSNIYIDVDPYFQTAAIIYANTYMYEVQDVTNLYDEELLQNGGAEYYQQMTALIAYQGLMRPTEIPSTGSAYLDDKRLLVRPLTVQLMSALLGISALLVTAAAFVVPKRAFLPHEPGSILSVATLLAGSSSLLQSLQHFGSASINAIRAQIGNSFYHSSVTVEGEGGNNRVRFCVLGGQEDEILLNTADGNTKAKLFQPVVLHPILRIGVFFISVGIILTLEITLRRSRVDEGLGDVEDQTYLHYTWTLIPAIVMSLLSLFFSAVDLQTRILAPYASLVRGGGFESSINLDLLDRATPFILWHEIRTRCYPGAMATIAASISPLFTIFAGNLFSLQTLPSTSDVYLQTIGSFNVDANASLMVKIETQYDSIFASLILENNFSYPAFTYQNLAFPIFDLISGTMDNNTISDSLSSLPINATVPALRPKLNCRQYNASELNAIIYTNGSYKGYVPYDGYWNVLQIDIPEEQCLDGLDPQEDIINIALNLGPQPPIQGVFGYGSTGNSSFLASCSGSLYAWGSYDFSTSPPSLSFVSAMGCNETFEIVDVEITFFGPDLEIHPSYPPVPIESSARSTTIQVDQTPEGLYVFLVNASSTALLDRFFGILTTSPYAVPLSALTDDTQIQQVADAIQFQQGILVTQWVNGVLRMPANESNATLIHPPVDIAEGNDARNYSATITDPAGYSRVIQSSTNTRVLEALLAAVLLFSYAGWALMPRTAILTHRPTSIASVASRG